MKNPTQFGASEPITPSVLPSASYSVISAPDDSAAAILFRNCALEINLDSKEMSAVAVATLQLPTWLPCDRGLIGYLADLRGKVCKDADARAVLMVDLGGTSHIIEFPYEQEIHALYDRDLFSKERRNPASIDGDMRPLPPCVVTVVLSVQRRSRGSVVRLTLDSLDVSIATTLQAD